MGKPPMSRKQAKPKTERRQRHDSALAKYESGEIEEVERPERPPKGMTMRSYFWIRHWERFDCCTCAVNDYECLLADAEYYADCTVGEMPESGREIQSAKSVVRAFAPGGSVAKRREQ
jgi:hypothetical protein